MSVLWNSVTAEQKRWTDQVCQYLDDWSPEPPEMPACRAAAFSAVRERLVAYTGEHGETLRTRFRLALILDIHRRFVHLHGHDVDEGPIELYGICKRDPDLASETWAGQRLATLLDRRMAEFASDSSRADPDPDVMTAAGTSDLPALVALAEQRRNLVKLLESDSNP